MPEFVHMTAREHDFHGLSCVLFGGSCVPLVVVVVLFTCTFLVSPGGSCVRFWWVCILVKDFSTSTDHISRKSKLESSATWPLLLDLVPATGYPDCRLDLLEKPLSWLTELHGNTVEKVRDICIVNYGEVRHRVVRQNHHVLGDRVNLYMIVHFWFQPPSLSRGNCM